MLLGNYVQLVIAGYVQEGDYPNQPIVNSFAYRFTSPSSFPSDRSGFAQVISNVVWPALQPILHSDLIGLWGLVGYPQTDSYPYPEVVALPNASGTGTRLPLECAVHINTLSGLRGRNWNGRKLFGPVLSSHVTDDKLNAAGIAAYSTLFSPLVSDQNFAYDSIVYNMQPVIWSQTLTGDPHSNPGVGSLLTNISICPYVTQLKRRRPRLLPYVLSACCSNRGIPRALYATISCPAIPALDGYEFTLTGGISPGLWFASVSPGGGLPDQPYGFPFLCSGSPPFEMEMNPTGAPRLWNTSGYTVSQSCPPLAWDSGVIPFQAGSPAPFAGESMRVSVSTMP
jgi:hypothetical protein